jgi:hypothetical protein
MQRAPIILAEDGGARSISPTDISQFIRLEQCERYLRLRLHERAHGTRFLRDYGVKPQSIPPLLTRSGARFELRVEEAAAERFPCRNFAGDPGQKRPANDNEEVVRLAADLAPASVRILFQPRLQATLGDWLIRGDVDILRLERDADGTLRILIADMKSSTSAKVEHRLQVAFYLEILAELLLQARVAHAPIAMGILYRGPAGAPSGLTAQEQPKRQTELEAAERQFGVSDALLEVIADVESYRGSVRDLVTGPQSTARRVAEADFDEIVYHLTYKCDGCLYNEFCMKWSAERDDLSLLPHLLAEEKSALQRAGVRTVQEMATLKDLRSDSDGANGRELVPAAGKEALVKQLGASWPVGPHLDELVHRARRYRKMKHDAIEALSYIPSKGYGSLPYSDAEHNPNLVRIYIDAQHDYLQDRIYMLGALVVASENGQEPASRRRSIVQLSEGPPDSPERERELFVRFAREVVRAVVELGAPDEAGEASAPIHLIFFNHFEQRLLLEGLSRHLTSILEATPLYDFVTQLAAFDSPVLTYLDQEIRELKNYPMVCQSLQAVASYLRFDWNQPQPYRDIFRTRMFDYWNKFDWGPGGRKESLWYTGRSRFNSQIPLEYAYAAWDELQEPPAGKADARDEFASYRGATLDLLRGFHARRLEALERVAQDFKGNRQTLKRAFVLPDLAHFVGKAQTLAQALDEFVRIERHTELAAWKTAHLAPPERRVLSGETLIVSYHEVDQELGTAERNRENLRRFEQAERYRAQSSDGKLTRAESKETHWSQDGMRFRLRLACEGVDCGAGEALALTSLREGERVVLMPRTTFDTRPGADPTPFTPTPKQLLWGARAEINAIREQRGADGPATDAMVEVEMREAFGGNDGRGFVFGSMQRPLRAGERYTLDTDPNDWYGSFCAEVVEGLCAGESNVLYERLEDRRSATVDWPAAAGAGQRRFLQGLDAFQRIGLIHDFEAGKREYIGDHGASPLLLVQGPPGTGKSYATAFAVFARLQGAMAAGRDFRVFVGCKTHAATDVLLTNVAEVKRLLCSLHTRRPDLFDDFFDARLLAVPLYRLDHDPPDKESVGLRRKSARLPGEALAADTVLVTPWCVVAATPAATRRLLKEKWNTLFGQAFVDCLVLDEASQMNLPEAIMAALPLKAGAQIIVVGDHRQMPPIVKHDWTDEARRTFKEFRSYESLFLTLLALDPPMIKFAESFRLHADMAEFLRREIYAQDGIAYFSRRHEALPACEHADPFVASVLSSEHAIVVIVHDEDQSMLRNPFEESLIVPLLDALAAAPYDLDAAHGLGVVVPHRAQRAALQSAVPALSVIDPQTGSRIRSAVDTVERFQGDERSAILVGATESDPHYLLVSSAFLLDPRRLTVALSRAKTKLILIAAQSVFSLFIADEETFANAQLWKNLLRKTCTTPLWSGERDGRHVQVWGSPG